MTKILPMEFEVSMWFSFEVRISEDCSLQEGDTLQQAMQAFPYYPSNLLIAGYQKQNVKSKAAVLAITYMQYFSCFSR